MCDACTCDREEDLRSGRKMRLDGTKWEYPIPKSKEYWEKFCDDEEKKLIVVRNPSFKFSYRSISRNDSKLVNFRTHGDGAAFNPRSVSNSTVDVRETSEGSLREASPLKSKFNLGEGHSSDAKLLPKSIPKAPSRAFSKSSDATCNLPAPTKVTGIPKLEAAGSQPRFPKIVDDRNDGETRGCSFSTLPVLAPSRSTSRPILKKSHKNHPDTKFSTSFAAQEDYKKNHEPTTDQDSLKYYFRSAHKALKQLRGDKKLNRGQKNVRNSFSTSSNDSSASDDDKRGLIKGGDKRKRKEEECFRVGRKERERKSLMDSEFASGDVERESLKLEETTSKTIPTGSRSTSGPSPEFSQPYARASPSSRVLSSIPKLSGFPRKNRDRCLSCLYKSFEGPSPRKISFPLTALRRTVSSPRTRARSSSGSSASDDSVSNLENALQGISNGDVAGKGVTFDGESRASGSPIVKEPAASSVGEERREKIVETRGREGAPDSEASRETITRRDKGDQREGDRSSMAKNRNEATSSGRVASFEQSKVSSSFDSGSSDEGDRSFAISIGDDQSRPKYLAPCHAPTVLSPSLEPLRALRNRKPTTLQDRIAFYEAASMKKSVSADDCDDVREQPRSRGVFNKNKPTDEPEERASRPGVGLTRAKSVSEKLTLENAEHAGEKEQRVLRKGASLPCFAALEDIASDTSEISPEASKDALRKLRSARDNGPSKTMAVGNFSKVPGRPPLTRADEITEIFRNLEPNASSTDALDALYKEFLERLSKVRNSNAGASNERIERLTKLLVDSKRYLYPDKFPSDLLFSSNQPPPCNPRLLRRLLPAETYNLVAPLLGLPEWHPKKTTSFEEQGRHDDPKRSGEESVISDDLASLAVHPATPRHVESLSDEEKVGQRRYNPYALFLTRPRREVITWRPLTERDLEGYDPDATLKMRADNMMKRICQEFCQWVDSLGGTDKTIDEEVLRDMFEIDFNAEICRALQVSIEEMPVVPTEVALTRNSPGASKLAMTRKHVMKDAKAEQRAAKTKAFGTTIPWKFQFVPPNNQVQRKWLQCENVPKGLETMEVVWKDITHLKSVRGFVEWLQQHPEVPPPEALKTIVSMDIEALRQIEEDEAFAHLELDINQIRSLRVEDSADVVA